MITSGGGDVKGNLKETWKAAGSEPPIIMGVARMTRQGRARPGGYSFQDNMEQGRSLTIE
jgi:hypothetical protein